MALDLTAIKARRTMSKHLDAHKNYTLNDIEITPGIDIDSLIAEVERQANEIKQLEEYRELYYSVMQRIAEDGD